MKRSLIVASSLGLLGLTAMSIGAVSLAGTSPSKSSFMYGSGQRMMINKHYATGMNNRFMDKDALFTSTGDREAYHTAVTTAITKADYSAYVAANTTYNITYYMTQTEFTDMIARIAQEEKISTALLKGDYTTWKSLNSGNHILDIITSESKFTLLQEIATYQEKIKTLQQELGIDEGPGGRGNFGQGLGKDRREMGMPSLK